MTQMTEKKKPLIILTGPTAVGKTAASIGLAKAIGGEIISADSMQVYRHMDIGSAKILPEEMKGVKHYLIDVLNPEEEFNVAVFQKMAKDAMVEIYKRGRIPLIQTATHIIQNKIRKLIRGFLLPFCFIMFGNLCSCLMIIFQSTNHPFYIICMNCICRFWIRFP